MSRSLLVPALFALLCITGCSENPSSPSSLPSGSSTALFILNEGNFGRGNSTLSVYNPDSGTIVNDAFRAVNGRGLGDTGNSLAMSGDALYIVMNGSNTIEVVDASTLVARRTISCRPGASPRHLAFMGDGKAYVSNLYLNSVTLLDPGTGVLIADLPTGPNPEQILVHGTDVYVANSGFGNGRSVTVIDHGSRQIVKSILVSDGPTFLVDLGNETAALLCSGATNDYNNPDDDTPGMLYVLDLRTRALRDSLVIAGHPKGLATDGKGFLYTIEQEGVTRISVSEKTLTRSFIPGYYYGLAADPRRNLLYLTKALDFVQPGRLEVRTLDGTLKGTITVGIIPGTVLSRMQ